MDQMKTGRFIAELRKEHNMTQRNLAEKLGVTDRAISKWENGRGLPDVSLMKPLCEILGISVTELLNGEQAEDRVNVNTVETTVYEVLADREIQLKSTERLKKKYSALRIGTLTVCAIVAALLMFMVFSGLRGEGYSVNCFLQTQRARMVGHLIEKEQYEDASKHIGFSHRDTGNARKNWVTGMKSFVGEFIIESIKIEPIILEDYFPMGRYYITVYDYESQVNHIYEGMVTCQNGGITFAYVNIPDGSVDMRRDAIGYTLNKIFATYNPG